MPAIQEICDEDTAIEAGQRAYQRLSAAAFRERGEQWDFIPDRRWTAEEGERGRWIISGYAHALHFDEPPLIRFRTGGGRLKRMSD